MSSPNLSDMFFTAGVTRGRTVYGLVLCDFCHADFSSYDPTYFGLPAKTSIGLGFTTPLRDVTPAEHTFDKVCSQCQHRLAFLEPRFNWRGVVLIAIAFALIGLAVLFRSGGSQRVTVRSMPAVHTLADLRPLLGGLGSVCFLSSLWAWASGSAIFICSAGRNSSPEESIRANCTKRPNQAMEPLAKAFGGAHLVSLDRR